MPPSELMDALKSIEKKGDGYWLQTLDERKKKELEFHDKHRDGSAALKLNEDTYEKFYGNKKYYSTTRSSQNYTQNWIKKFAKNRVFLDYACGNGQNAILAAKAGAELAIGIDISSVSIANAKELAKKEKVAGNTFFLQADAENTQLPAHSIDAVICSGMLHHLDLSYAFPELRRILKQGGRVLAVEALDYNPLIKLYRKFTPQMRTEWERNHILSLKDVELARRFFRIGEIRYWHVTNFISAHIRVLEPVLERLDEVLTKIPFLQLMAWIFTFEMIKNE